MMLSRQSHINARGDVAGRDVHKYYEAVRPNPFDAINQRILDEMAEQPSFNETLEILKRHIEPNAHDLRSLEVKLTDAELTQLIIYAKDVKELFAKKLTEAQYLKSAQEFYAQLLAKVRMDFNSKIYARIGKIPQEDILEEVTGKIIDPIFALLGDNPLSLTHEEILGMVYFLTGNCHIDWK